MANGNDSAIVETIIKLPPEQMLPYFLEVHTKIIDDSTYWQMLAAVWMSTEICSPYLPVWRELYLMPRRNRNKLMKGADRKVWHSLVKRGAPKIVTVYRAMNPGDDPLMAISYTLSRKVAEKLANGRKIIKWEIPKECIIAYFDRRREQEIIHLWEEVKV